MTRIMRPMHARMDGQMEACEKKQKKKTYNAAVH